MLFLHDMWSDLTHFISSSNFCSSRFRSDRIQRTQYNAIKYGKNKQDPPTPATSITTDTGSSSLTVSFSSEKPVTERSLMFAYFEQIFFPAMWSSYADTQRVGRHEVMYPECRIPKAIGHKGVLRTDDGRLGAFLQGGEPGVVAAMAERSLGTARVLVAGLGED